MRRILQQFLVVSIILAGTAWAADNAEDLRVLPDKFEGLAPAEMLDHYLRGLAYEALETGGTMMVALNAANEVAVEAFLAGRLPFPAITRVIEATMAAHAVEDAGTLSAVRRADDQSRAHARILAAGLELKV